MKKVLSFVLILALVLGSFSFAFGLSDIEDSANTEAITVANDLGIITGFPDGSFMPEKAVNRAEFAAMITRALAIPESALAAYSSTSFKDTAGYGWAVPYLAFCESKGIMIGDGMGNAMPGRTISVNEAITMAARAIGYTENSAMLVGTWPANYVTLAQTLGLYDDVAGTTAVSRESAAQVIYNSLRVPLVTVNADGVTNEVMDNTVTPAVAKTMLTAGLGCTVDAATILTPANSDGAMISMTKYFGAFASVFKNSDGDIVAVGDVKSTALTGELNAAKDTFTLSDDTEYSITNTVVTSGAVKMTNMGAAATLNWAGLSTGTTVTVNVKTSGKTITELFSEITWTYGANAFQYEEDMLDLEDAELNSLDFAKNDNNDIDRNSFWLQGATSLEDIDVDDVVYAYVAPSGTLNGKIVRVAVGKETVEGTVTKTTMDTSNEYVYKIDGKDYKTATAKGTDLSILGDKGTATLDFFGEIFVWDADDSASGNYAVLLKQVASDGAYDPALKIKLFTAAGEEVIYTVKGNATTDAAVISATSVGAIVEFSLDSSGKINKVVLAPNLTAIAGTDKTSKDGSLIGTTIVKSGCVAFVYDVGDAEWTIGDVTKFDSDIPFSAANTATTWKALDKNGKITAFTVDDAIYGAGDATFGVINTTSAAVNADEDNVQYLDGFLGAKVLSAFTDEADNSATQYSQTANTGIVNITVDANGVVTNVNAVANADINASVHAIGVTVTAVSGNIITVSPGSVALESYRIADNAVIYVYDTDDSKWVVKTTALSLKNKNNVRMYQSDKDVVGFDYVMAW